MAEDSEPTTEQLDAIDRIKERALQGDVEAVRDLVSLMVGRSDTKAAATAALEQVRLRASSREAREVAAATLDDPATLRWQNP